eukprot:TRINITY_DN6705_c0_g1_i2.p1 TRINITY_DN6705_c0_g1~~TRINITY_DN6705_c0_g1_i2.p1  ORF type:complete len:558 (-),score=122.15 TRINITY_DN6705_c0_g1_i2:103-1776(-)
MAFEVGRRVRVLRGHNFPNFRAREEGVVAAVDAESRNCRVLFDGPEERLVAVAFKHLRVLADSELVAKKHDGIENGSGHANGASFGDCVAVSDAFSEEIRAEIEDLRSQLANARDENREVAVAAAQAKNAARAAELEVDGLRKELSVTLLRSEDLRRAHNAELLAERRCRSQLVDELATERAERIEAELACQELRDLREAHGPRALRRELAMREEDLNLRNQEVAQLEAALAELRQARSEQDERASVPLNPAPDEEVAPSQREEVSTDANPQTQVRRMSSLYLQQLYGQTAAALAERDEAAAAAAGATAVTATMSDASAATVEAAENARARAHTVGTAVGGAVDGQATPPRRVGGPPTASSLAAAAAARDAARRANMAAKAARGAVAAVTGAPPSPPRSPGRSPGGLVSGSLGSSASGPPMSPGRRRVASSAAASSSEACASGPPMRRAASSAAESGEACASGPPVRRVASSAAASGEARASGPPMSPGRRPFASSAAASSGAPTSPGRRVAGPPQSANPSTPPLSPPQSPGRQVRAPLQRGSGTGGGAVAPTRAWY